MAGTIVQSVNNQDDSGAGGTTIAVTINGVAAGNTLVAHVGGDHASAFTMSVSDGVSYTAADSLRKFGSSQRAGQVFYKENSGSGSFTVTMTSSLSATVNRRIRVHEISGLLTTGSLDQGFGQGVLTPGTGTDAVSSGASSATTNANDFVMGFSQDHSEASPGTGTCVAGTGYTLAAANVLMTCESKSVAATGAQTATFTQSVNNDRITHVVAFKEAASVGGIGVAGTVQQKITYGFAA